MKYCHANEPSNLDANYWTLLLLTPKQSRYQLPSPSRSEGVEVSSRMVSTLSSVHQALSWASSAWVKVVTSLEHSLNLQSSNDFFADSPDLSHSRRCFWVINTVDEHENLIAEALAEWDWYRNMNELRELANRNEKIDKWLDSIATEYFRLKDSEARLRALRERAKSRRDGVRTNNIRWHAA